MPARLILLPTHPCILTGSHHTYIETLIGFKPVNFVTVNFVTKWVQYYRFYSVVCYFITQKGQGTGPGSASITLATRYMATSYSTAHVSRRRFVIISVVFCWETGMGIFLPCSNYIQLVLCTQYRQRPCKLMCLICNIHQTGQIPVIYQQRNCKSFTKLTNCYEVNLFHP